MKVRELIEVLQKCNPEHDVILQRDPEGNGYGPLSGAEAAVYDEQDNEVIHKDDVEDQDDNCVVLWPVY